MADLTLEQQQALARARARQRQAAQGRTREQSLARIAELESEQAALEAIDPYDREEDILPIVGVLESVPRDY